MWQFIKFVFATIVGIFAAFILLIFVFAGIGAAFGGKEKVTVKENSVLAIDFSKSIQESPQANPFENLSFSPSDGPMVLYEVKDAILKAAKDDKIKGIYLKSGDFSGGYAMMEEVREALLRFKESGKFIYAFADVYSEKGYYLASVADKIFLNPVGGLELNGLRAEVVFLKGMFEKLDIKPEVFRVGDFKSAVEPFLDTKMSEANRLQTSSYLNSIYNHYLEKVSQARSIPIDRLRIISDSMLVQETKDAVALGLVTDTIYFDQVEDELKSALGLSDSDKLTFISPQSYAKANVEASTSSNRIAVVIAEGDIVDDADGMSSAIVGKKVAAQLRKLRKDKKVKAIVLRINSPGGSALASDVMWREVKLTSAEKPIIASMSDVAASGGYYMAMACDTIVAYPNTITGSIGVFGMYLYLGDFLKNKLGITTESVETGQFSNIGDPSEQLSDAERRMIQRSVEETYRIFTNKAAQGRGLAVDSLVKLASGRVWTGEQAIKNGLADVEGGLETAIRIAAEKAGVADDYAIRYYPQKKTFIEVLTEGSSGEAAAAIRTWWAKEEMGVLYPYAEKLKKLQRYQGVQARMTEEVSIR